MPEAVSAEPVVEWEKTFGGSDYDYGWSVQQTSDGGYIIAGFTHSYGAGYRDVYLVKTDSAGNLQWEKTFGGSNFEHGRSVQQTSDGGYIIAGETYSYGAGSYDVYLVKTDSAGNLQWEKTFGGSDYDVGYSVQQTSDGGYIIAGYTYSYGAGSCDVYLVKTNSAGNLQWQKTFGGADVDWGLSVQQTSDGGYVIAGYTYSYGAGSTDFYLVKTDSAGNLQWQKTFGGADADGGYSVRQTSDGGYIIAGWTRSYSTDYDVYLVKTDSAGNLQWQKTFSERDSDVGHSVQQTSDGGYIIAGLTSYDAGSRDVYLVKTDSAGNLQWQKTFGGNNHDRGFSVQQTSDGGYIIAGWTRSYGAGSYDVYLIKVSAELPVKGVDVSSWQDCQKMGGQDIDWSQVYGEGYRFALVRASWWDSGVDKCFVTNMENGHTAGMLMGAYHFAYPEYADAGSEARHFFNVAKDYLKEGYLMPALDIENDPDSSSYPYNLEPEGLSNWVNKWMDTVQALARQELGTEVEPMLYVNRTYANFLDEYLADIYDLWIAHPTCNPDGEPDTKKWSNWAFWQYYMPVPDGPCPDNSTGLDSVPGINGPVDLDVFNGDMSRLNTFKISAWQPDFWILYHLCSPADMVVTDPDGLIISKELNQIPGAAYVEIDIDQEGDLDKEISIPHKKVGYYQITIVPEPNALPTDTYSLAAVIDGQTMVLAEDVQIQAIPAEGYEFESKLNRSDFDSDGDVDFVDYAVFASHWMNQDCNYPDWCGGSDLDYSGVVDFNDLAIFTDNWLWEKIPADFDIDGDVDFQDFAIFALAWLTEEGQTGYDSNCDIALPYDGAIDEKDFQVFSDNWLLGR